MPRMRRRYAAAAGILLLTAAVVSVEATLGADSSAPESLPDGETTVAREDTSDERVSRGSAGEREVVYPFSGRTDLSVVTPGFWKFEAHFQPIPENATSARVELNWTPDLVKSTMGLSLQVLNVSTASGLSGPLIVECIVTCLEWDNLWIGVSARQDAGVAYSHGVEYTGRFVFTVEG